MAQVAERLVGRTAELEAFDGALTGIQQGASAAIELVGEPGIGKTRLLAELVARANSRGHLALSGSASELEQDLPFWVFVDALDEYIRGLEPDRLDELDPDVRTELSTVFPTLSRLASGRKPAPQHERYRSHRAVRELLELLARTRPLVLVLDDVHWADPASVELLGALLQRPPAAPVLLAMAVRPRQLSERLTTALERAHRAGVLVRSELGTLTRTEARELVGAAVDDSDGVELYKESGGNPFYLEQLARSQDRASQIVHQGPDVSLGGAQVPRSVAAALAEELGLLSKDARLVLEGAAVAGDPFEPELAAAAAAVPESAAIEALNELLRLDLVRATDVPRRFRFRHPLVRRAVYETTSGGWRITAHERCAEGLAARGSPVSMRAHHVELSARQGDAAAVACLREAGEAAAPRAPASAAHWFGEALRLLSEAAPSEERIELLVARSGALAATGQLGDSHSALLECMRIVPLEAEATRVRLTAACAGIEHLLGRYTEAHAHLEAAFAELPDPDSPQGAGLMIELAGDSLYRGDYDAMRVWAGRAVDAAAELGDRALIAAALAVRAMAGAVGGVAAEGQAHRAEAANLIDELSDEELGGRLDALAHLATAEMYLDHFAAVVPHAQRALRIGRATGQGDLFPLIVPMLGGSLWVQGRMAESGEVLDGAIAAARLVDNVQGLAWNLFNRSYAAFAAGDIELALATAEEAFELSKELDDGPVPAHAAVALAYALLETGHAERGAELLVTKAGGDELRLIGGGWRARYLELLTRCYLAAGKRAEAERAAAASQECADAVGLPMAAAMAELAEAALALDAGDAARAAEQARAAAAVLEQAGDRFDAAMARLLAGRAFSEAGEHDTAAAELEIAAAAFHSFGSTRYRAQAERELRKLGRSTPHRSKPGQANGSGVGTLSERELQVGRLVVDRKTNPEIAAELFLSLKTVESHLRNIFRKLDVRSRVEVARAIERADRAGDGTEEASERTATIVSAERLTVERDRLQAEVRAKMDELRSSRARVVEAGDTERRRLERNLHDGAQQRLVSLSLSLGMMERQLESPDEAAKVAALRSELADALDELRELARGLHPAILADHGLEPALESLAARARIRVELDIDVESRPPAAVEAAIYYVVAEALTNVQKYAQASLAKVNVRLHEDEIVLDVVDDGIGGADATLGTGLLGLADRVEALGGSIAIDSPTGGGTSLRARIPHENLYV
jgi:signal transduction histidine kinase